MKPVCDERAVSPPDTPGTRPAIGLLGQGATAVRGLLASGRLGFILSRYLVAMVAASEALLLSRALGPQRYGRYALVAQVAMLLMFVAAGSASGYVYAYYKRPSPSLDRVYVAGAAVQYCVGTLLGSIILFLYEPYLLLSSALFLIFAPYYLTEPMLRVRNRFTLAVAAKGLASLLTLALAALALLRARTLLHRPLATREALLVLFAGSGIGYGSYYGMVRARRLLPLRAVEVARAIFERETWREYWREILVPGLRLNLQSVVLLLFTYVDRLFIERFRPPSALSVYALGWQLSQGALLLLGSLNLISGVRIGESLSAGCDAVKRTMRRQLEMTSIAAVFGLAALLGGSMILSRTFYRDYESLVPITVIISVGYFASGVSGAITGVLHYENRQLALAGAYGLVGVVSIVVNIATLRFGWWYGVPIAASSAALVLASLWVARYALGVVGEMGDSRTSIDGTTRRGIE